jgi:hypothetical protein
MAADTVSLDLPIGARGIQHTSDGQDLVAVNVVTFYSIEGSTPRRGGYLELAITGVFANSGRFPGYKNPDLCVISRPDWPRGLLTTKGSSHQD